MAIAGSWNVGGREKRTLFMSPFTFYPLSPPLFRGKGKMFPICELFLKHPPPSSIFLRGSSSSSLIKCRNDFLGNCLFLPLFSPFRGPPPALKKAAGATLLLATCQKNCRRWAAKKIVSFRFPLSDYINMKRIW